MLFPVGYSCVLYQNITQIRYVLLTVMPNDKSKPVVFGKNIISGKDEGALCTVSLNFIGPLVLPLDTQEFSQNVFTCSCVFICVHVCKGLCMYCMHVYICVCACACAFL